ncbi:aldose 1-epimerase [Dongia mobilis]|uniref:Aldose 1-epimerase n=1 Tax=Dongia mobilis TaxID=578943 RepID=A0A4V3DFC2_9PROT|nr:aldose epimerase family protein [Dongia mobilis]TDQ86495.1 aldose 1-epimerase [Dongia mobilis]
MSISPFGLLDDGAAVERIEIDSGGVTLGVLTLGATIQDLQVDTGKGAQRRVLGFAQLSDYRAHSPYFGCIAGRYANRIAEGICRIDGKTYQLTRNEAGRTHLHGGERGFSHRIWSLRDQGPSHVTLELQSAHGEEGYPGNLLARCTYRVTGDGEITLELGATTDRATIVNLAAHSYFNLDLDEGAENILDHLLEVPAAHYLPVDAHLIPTGEIAAVGGTPFDFRVARSIRAAGDSPSAYDHNLVLARKRLAEPRPVARLIGPLSGTMLEIRSTEPGLQFYDGARVGPLVPGHDGRRYGAYAGLCLEPQNFPDAPNRPDFPDPVLRPGESYRQVTVYRFSGV